MSEEDILDLVKKDKWMMDILRAAESLNLPDWWIGAGFVRSKVWDHQHAYKKRTPLPDVDLIYFDKSDFSKDETGNFSTKAEDKYQDLLNKHKQLCVKWSVTNQARMHIYHNRAPYRNCEEALSEWAETATCVGARSNKGKLSLIAPYGVKDLVKLILRPIPEYKEKFAFDPDTFERRIRKKKWLQKWPKLKIALGSHPWGAKLD
ncbi:MAG: nucleotidyltransferase family protein [Candidatus Levybacteria bacterium]|nr:nucleotidyltransferase family protein [Candidatus Levybacteria bacterium]